MNKLLSIFSPLKETVNSRNGHALDRLEGIDKPKKKRVPSGHSSRKSVAFDMTPRAQVKHTPPRLGGMPLARERRELPPWQNSDEELEDDRRADSDADPDATGAEEPSTEPTEAPTPVEPSEVTETIDEPTEPADTTDGEFSFTAFVNHRWRDDAMQIQVEWDGGQRTWEPETMLHADAPAALLDYWRRQPDGRPDNPRQPGLYEIHAIRKHSRDRKRLFVEWVGYGPGESTWEPRAVVADAAPEILSEYLGSLPRPKRRRVR